MIDNTDLQIIYALQENGRISFARLARMMGISIFTLTNRVNRLLERGYIVINAIPNHTRLGYPCQALITARVVPSKLEGICETLSQSLHTSMVVTAFGRYDLLIIVAYPDRVSLQNYIASELMAMPGILEIRSYQIDRILKGFITVFETQVAPDSKFRLDTIDLQLVSELMKDGRATYACLAQKLNVSIPTVSRRLAFLQKENVLKIKALPNPLKMGFSANGFTLLSVEPRKFDRACVEIMKHPELHMVMALNDGFNIFVISHCTDIEEMYRFIRDAVIPVDGIYSIETFIRGEIKKRYYGWFLPEEGFELVKNRIRWASFE